ncbi:DNA-directed RNA polymerase subunit M/transcription elongation factor TFIIS [Parabacteroides sp. PFB2-10]|nr:DNA-directed RNA polymerase subunit M/transcription elongation factor TFIIS [Parabacteroides sp. PFB2-10]
MYICTQTAYNIEKERGMKRIFCPKCDNQLTFDETKYPKGKVLVFVCPQCTHQFKIRLGKKIVKTETGEEKEVNEADFSCGYITVIENNFGYKQDLPLVEGDNVIGRRNKDTDGVHVAIITSDPSMGRKHCVIHVKPDGNGHYIYTLRDFPSLTGTFVRNVLVGKKEQVVIEDEAIVTIGATTFILHAK